MGAITFSYQRWYREAIRGRAKILLCGAAARSYRSLVHHNVPGKSFYDNDDDHGLWNVPDRAWYSIGVVCDLPGSQEGIIERGVRSYIKSAKSST